MSDCLLEKGSNVIYGPNGVCNIEDIKDVSFAGEMAKKYYILRPLNSPSSVLYVPFGNEKLTSMMRNTLTKNEIDDILVSAKGKEIEWLEDKNKRSEYFHKILASGKYEMIILMIRCIIKEKDKLSDLKRRLNLNDENDLKLAQKCIEEEFSFTLNLPEDSVSSYIKNMIEPAQA